MRGGIRSEIFWGYVASAAKVGSWVILSAILFRTEGLAAAGLLTWVRGTLGLLNYASAGLAPTMIHFAAKDESERGAVFRTGIGLSWRFAGLGWLVLVGWCLVWGHTKPGEWLVLLFGTGVVVRVVGDALGAVLQSTGRIRTEYRLQALVEVVWALVAGAGIWRGVTWQVAVGGGYLVATVGVTAMKWMAVREDLRAAGRGPQAGRLNGLAGRLLRFGGFVMAAQVADFLYAPTDFILIRWFIDLRTVGVYTPAVQIDSGLVLAVSGLAAVMLPKSAEAFGRGDAGTLWRYYVRGTVGSFLLLLVGAAAIWAVSPFLFKVWLGNSMVETQRILPLVLVSTVIGGSARVGGSVLLGMGRARAYAISALVAGVVNVVVSIVLVRFFGMGLAGIVIGTVVAVVGRCGVWMPWYVRRVVGKDGFDGGGPAEGFIEA